MDKAFKSIGLASFDSPEITARLVVPPSVLRVISRVIFTLLLRYFCVIFALFLRYFGVCLASPAMESSLDYLSSSGGRPTSWPAPIRRHGPCIITQRR